MEVGIGDVSGLGYAEIGECCVVCISFLISSYVLFRNLIKRIK